MAKIDELLKELCPDGVEYVTIGESCEILDSMRKPISKGKRKPGVFPYYGANGIQDWVDDYIFDGDYILIGEDGSVINKDKTPVLNWASGKIWVNNHAHVLKEGSDQILLKYIYYVLKTVDVSGIVRGTPPKINQANLRGITFPLPPLPIQQHIVEVLDTFTDAISNLEEELALREKQFEYYREQLLAFDDESSLGGKLFSGKVEWKELQDVSSIVRGASPRPIKNFLSDKSEGIPWIKIGDADPNDKYIVSTAEFINKQGASKSRFLKKGSFILSNSMSFGRPYILAIDGCIHDGWIAISDYERQINADYLYYVLKTANVKKYWSMSANNGAVSNLNADIVRGTIIPIPSLCAQQEIVEILDTFEAMIANIKEEIALRTKQYEYYREKLLSFGK